jgi:hypothetical protein
METDSEIAARVSVLQARARDYSLVEIPSYEAWSNKKNEAGESPAFIAHLDAMSMWLLPEELSEVGEAEFEELLQDIKSACEPQRFEVKPNHSFEADGSAAAQLKR